MAKPKEPENMRIWNVLGKTDPAHTKQFTRAGGFRGTAIKPMWANQRMTEFFGPCGIGWGQGRPEFETVNAGEEIMVYCTVRLWYKEGDVTSEVYGVGGDKVVSQVFLKDVKGQKIIDEAKGGYKTYPQTDDEAFKKAYTDAISNAMKFIGVAADVHMGLFDDSKYVREVAAEFDEAKKAEVNAEIDRQKNALTSALVPSAIPPELDWMYQKASGVLICRVMNAEKKAKADGKEYVVITANNELDKGKKPLLYYWHATHRDDLIAAKGKVVKLMIVAKEKGFTVDAVLEIDGRNMVREEQLDAEKDNETQGRLLASVLDFDEEELREFHGSVCGGSWTCVLEALRQRKAEVDAGVEAGAR